MAITIEALRAVGATPTRAAEVLEPLKAACALYDITTPARQAAFLAQVGHESGGFRYTSEIWGPSDAQRRYEGRRDLGNTQPGDGERFKGHGFLQTTGRANHAAVRDRLRARLSIDVPDFEQEPEKLTELQWACLSAADYWDMRRINELADAGDFLGITRRVNGGTNGLADRHARWERVKAVLEPAAPPSEPAHTPDPLAAFTAADTITPQPQEPAMPAPFLLAALPAIIDLVPKLGSIFASGSETSQRNVKAAEIVVGAAKAAIGAVNEQDLVERLQADPDAAQAVRQAVEAKWYEITEVGGGIQAARAVDAKYLQPDAKGFWHSPAFWISIMLLAMPFMLLVDLFFVHPDAYDANLRTQIITAVLVVVGMVGAYWLGTSASSQRKTDLLAK